MSIFDSFFPAAFSGRASDASQAVADRDDESAGARASASDRPGGASIESSEGVDRARGGCGCGCGHAAAPVGATATDESASRPETGQGDERRRVLLARTLNEWTLEQPEALSVFTELGLDACCGGERTLADACERHDLDAGRVLERLERVEA